jgi:hypothetical protein
MQTLRAQNDAAEQMKRSLASRQGNVQPEAEGSLNSAVSALDHYQAQLKTLAQLAPQMEADQVDPQIAGQYAAAYAQMERASEVLAQSQNEISTLLGPSLLMQRSMQNFQSTHESLAPEEGLGQVQGEASIQMQLYGVDVRKDETGRPILPPMENQSEEIKTRGLGQDLDVEHEADDHSMSLGDRN